MDKSFAQLLALYETGNLHGEELNRFFQLLEREENQLLLAAAIDEKTKQPPPALPADEALTEQAVQSLRKAMWQYDNTPSVPIRKTALRRRWGWAAAALLVITAGTTFYYLNNPRSTSPATTTAATAVIKAPQTNRATITLANGQVVYLDSISNGRVASQGNMSLEKTADGQLRYTTLAAGDNEESLSNTLYNPRGSRIIHLTLEDGSQVWLNAASSITYPVRFNNRQRTISVSGEAYFEVTDDARRPFRVTSGEAEIKVLGTSFNVNTYTNEPTIQVTLLHGKIDVAGNGNHALLKPGQQAAWAPGTNTGITVDPAVDLDEVMAWKNGRFAFGEKADIATIMRQIARWYDVEVELRGSFHQHFGGSISRDADAAKVFKVLEATGGIQCKVEGRTVIVTPG